mmetsp:Transcript_95833/g.293082  ORF Transcript_95833/g.293082 Transcript_95833/m.293082 type:complete len:239 (-) Transcript_95833:858-1574(-)
MPHAITVPIMKPVVSSSESFRLPWSAMTMPVKTYTGMPGTGGSMNMRLPMTKTRTHTMPKSIWASNSDSQLRKMYVAFDTPTCNMKISSAMIATQQRIPAQFHVESSSTNHSACCVNLPSFIAVPRSFLHFWFSMFKATYTGMKTFVAPTPMARTKSFLQNFASNRPKWLSPTMWTKASEPTSMKVQRTTTVMAAARKAMSVLPNSSEVKDTLQYIPPSRTIRQMTNCLIARIIAGAP